MLAIVFDEGAALYHSQGCWETGSELLAGALEPPGEHGFMNFTPSATVVKKLTLAFL